MLNQIDIRDLATIEALHLEFSRGSTVITGETGAGKSVFIEAIELALGGRASTNMIRPGKEKADISLRFDLTHFPHVIAKLQALDLHQEIPECIIRRVLGSDGRSRSYVNGLSSPLQLVKELGEQLFHLHSQHEQQVLLRAETQREMLDRYADHLPLLFRVKETAEALKSKEQQIKTLKAKTHEQSERIAYLRFQLEELHRIKLEPGEWERLEAEHKKLLHVNELSSHIEQVLQLIADDENQNLLSQLSDIRKILDSIRTLDEKIIAWIGVLDSILIQLTDLTSEIKNYHRHTEFDPEKLQILEERISEIFNISRKHKISPLALHEFKDQLEAEWQILEKSHGNLVKLEREQELLAEEYVVLADKLTLSRKEAAGKLEGEITTTIQTLDLPYASFRIKLEAESIAFSANGQEKVVFLIKTNPDQSLQPLAKVISGGELSRLSLAAHLALANQTSIPTLVFDEIDTGLSGGTAEKIGKLLRKLGESYQVFCITHQPQVAACGHNHLLVEKNFVGNTTHTELRLLSAPEKTHELARMLGGEKITQKTFDHAEELLQGV